jgi:hypothetical protein
MNTPIIINNVQTKTVECIIQDGITYCERSEMPPIPQEAAIWFLIFILIGAVWAYRDDMMDSCILSPILGGVLGFILSLFLAGFLGLVFKAFGF